MATPFRDSSDDYVSKVVASAVKVEILFCNNEALEYRAVGIIPGVNQESAFYL